MLTRRQLGAAAAGLGALAAGLSAPTVVRAQSPRTIRVGNWLPAHHLIPRGIMEPWARAIERETNGELRFEIMASALGPPPQTMDLLLDGAFDVGYGVSGHNPGRFTMTQVIDLPFMSPDPWAGAAASWSAFERYGSRYNEHRGARVVGLFVHSEPYIWMRGEPIRSIADLAGKRIRVGGNVTGRIVTMLGGTPVQLPPTEAQQAMARGVADGIAFPGESINFFGITPVIQGGTRFPGGLYTDTFWIAFNQRSWDSLSDAHKRAVEKHSGYAIAMRAGHAWTNGDRVGLAALAQRNVPIVTMADDQVAIARERLRPLEQEWLAAAQQRNLPGQEILEYTRTMVEQFRADRQVNVPGRG